MNFDNIRIPKRTEAAINSAVRKLPHTIVICGGAQADRKALALLLAKAHLCTSENKPCGRCSHCLKAEAGSHPDIHISEATESDKTPLNAENTKKNVIDKVSLYPNEAEKSVFILLNLHLPAPRSRESVQNRLLKTIEEPPAHAVFILTCDKAESLLDTVLSRAVIYSLGDVSDGKAGERDERARDIAERSVKAINGGSEFELMEIAGEMSKDNQLLSSVCEKMLAIFRDAMIQRINPSLTSLSSSPSLAGESALRLTRQKLLNCMETANEIIESASRNANNQLLITRFCSLFCRAAGR